MGSAILAVLTLTHDREAVLGAHVFQAQVRGFLPTHGTRIQHFDGLIGRAAQAIGDGGDAVEAS
jgi:hypothetical protein